MRQTNVGASGLRVSQLGLGTSTWGNTTATGEAEKILRRFLGAGGTLLNTSPGAPEEVLGALLDVHSRPDLIISSAAGVHPSLPVGRRVDCSRRALLSQLDRTLLTLGTDYLDIWSVGYWDAATPPQEVADTLDFAVRTGRVRYAGVRGYAGWQLAVTAAHCQIVAAQEEFNLLVRRPEEELLPATEHLGVGFFAGAPLAQGVLTGKYRDSRPAGSRGARGPEVDGYLEERSDAIVAALTTAAEGLGITPAAAAIAWARDQDGVTSAIVGARSEEQVAEALEADAVALPASIMAALTEISR